MAQLSERCRSASLASTSSQLATTRLRHLLPSARPARRFSRTAAVVSSRMSGGMQAQMKELRREMNENADVVTFMAGLRGSNIDESDFAAAGVTMRVVEATSSGAGDELPLEYKPELIERFWSRRPVQVTQRIFQLLSISGTFIASLLFDALNGRLKETEVARARDIREIVTSLGPAYIKLGQALSIRPDLLSPAAMRELQKLCDKVPSFDNETAMRLIESELGAPWTEFYSELGPDPVAAASLGQVYKGTLKGTGETVAVKVQRPFVLETVTVDLFVLRRVGLFLRRFPSISTDIVGLLDEWAARFFEELDYQREGENATRFAEQMKADLPQVVVPATFSNFTSRRVLTSAWIEGEKLSQSQEDDVQDLVGVGVICYLKQLLGTGFFHADPHPGNLIRCPDGRLAILDFGLMTTVDDDVKYGMIEAISHLVHRDYEAIVEDFVTLQFIPKDVDLKPLLPVLARVFDAALEGGGAKAFNFQELAADLAQITFDYPFRIPPYFALIIRAIGVLEGIALVGNPDFALVDEAYPYISKLLLTDDSPRLRAALTYMVYGKRRVFDAERLIDLLQSYETFVTASKAARGGALVPPAASPAAESSSSAREALTFLFSPQGVLFREFILDELVKGIDASARVQAAATVRDLGLSGVRLPVLLPFASGPRSVPLAPVVTEEDLAVLANSSKLLAFLTGGQFSGGEAPLLTPRLIADLLPLMPTVAREIAPQLAQRLSSRVLARAVRDNLVDAQYV